MVVSRRIKAIMPRSTKLMVKAKGILISPKASKRANSSIAAVTVGSYICPEY
jgi:hypothetical protein